MSDVITFPKVDEGNKIIALNRPDDLNNSGNLLGKDPTNQSGS